MVFRDIGQYGDIRSECLNIIQLKTADFAIYHSFGSSATCRAMETPIFPTSAQSNPP